MHLSTAVCSVKMSSSTNALFVAHQFYHVIYYYLTCMHMYTHTDTYLLMVFFPSLRASSYSSLSGWLSSTCSTDTVFSGKDTRGRPFTSLLLVRRRVMHFTRVWRFLHTVSIAWVYLYLLSDYQWYNMTNAWILTRITNFHPALTQVATLGTQHQVC